MTTKQRRDVYQDVTDRIVEALEAGTVPWRKPWKSRGGPYSLDGRKYRGVNVFLLELMPFSDPRWGTYKTIQKHGGQVRAGEKGTHVILWKPVRPKDADEEDDTVRPYILLRDYVVFNAEQADGLPELEHDDEREHTPIQAAEAIVEGYETRPPIHYGKNQAAYSPLLDCVYMPDAETFESEEAFYSTLFHELTHSTGHESRLKRIEPAIFGSDPYAREELVAEMGAAMLAGIAGLETHNGEQSAAYIAGWLKALKNDKKLVVKAAAAAQKAADLMLGTTFEEETKQKETRELIAA